MKVTREFLAPLAEKSSYGTLILVIETAKNNPEKFGKEVIEFLEEVASERRREKAEFDAAMGNTA